MFYQLIPDYLISFYFTVINLSSFDFLLIDFPSHDLSLKEIKDKKSYGLIDTERF